MRTVCVALCNNFIPAWFKMSSVDHIFMHAVVKTISIHLLGCTSTLCCRIKAKCLDWGHQKGRQNGMAHQLWEWGCNAPESRWLRITLNVEWNTPATILLTLSSSFHVKGLTQGWWDTSKEPHIRAHDTHAPVAAKVGSDTTCNALESRWLRSTLHAEWTTPTTIPLTLSSSHIRGLTRGWWDGL
jgi:hypothetical protein